jgi:F-type H+-transporting ATPase subunit epsilon
MFRLTIVTPERPFFDGECVSLVVPGTEGYLGVLTDHAPLLTAVAPGELRITESERPVERILAVSGGFFEVSHNHATLLAEAVEEPRAIDRARAQAALERARARLTHPEAGLDRVRAERALYRAKNRIDILRRHGPG